MPGRQKGAQNKDKVAFRERMKKYCETNGCDPHEWMADLLMKQKVPMDLKLQAAKELAQYLEPKLRSTELTGNPDRPLTHSLAREDRQAMINALLEKRGAPDAS